MHLTDSHCHLASQKFTPEELENIVQRAKDQGVTRMITLATNLSDCPTNIEISENFPEVYCAIGIHPCDVHSAPDNYLETLERYARHPRCVAIGETGLDYFHPAPEGMTDLDYHQRQRDFLRQHFELAKKLNKNIVIHTRDRAGKKSLDDSLSIYAEFANEVQAVFHCFLGPWENATRIIELGGIVSFTGITTFKSAKDTLAAAVKAPLGSFMIETDSPYLAPNPHRGKRNEPAYIGNIAEFLATMRGITIAELAAHTETTVDYFFKLRPNN